MRIFRKLSCTLVVLSAASLATYAVRAGVHKFVDRGSGHVYYTDRPSHSGYRLLIKTFPV